MKNNQIIYSFGEENEEDRIKFIDLMQLINITIRAFGINFHVFSI